MKPGIVAKLSAAVSVIYRLRPFFPIFIDSREAAGFTVNIRKVMSRTDVIRRIKPLPGTLMGPPTNGSLLTLVRHQSHLASNISRCCDFPSYPLVQSM